MTTPFILVGTPERMLEIQAPALLPLAACALAETPVLPAVLFVIANGLFITRVATTVVPFWSAWGLLATALAYSLLLWCRSYQSVFQNLLRMGKARH